MGSWRVMVVAGSSRGAFDVNLYTGTCKSGIFCESFIISNSVKRHFCQVKNSRLWHDLPLSVHVNDRLILLFRDCFIFMQSYAKKKTRENFRIYSNYRGIISTT